MPCSSCCLLDRRCCFEKPGVVSPHRARYDHALASVRGCCARLWPTPIRPARRLSLGSEYLSNRRPRRIVQWRRGARCMTTRVLLLSLCVALTHATASAQQKPDLSGDWVLSAEKSDFGPIPPPQCVGLKIAHKGSEFAIEETDERGANCALKLTYTIDGPAITYTTPAGVRNRARAAWVDAALVTQRVGDDGISVRV